MPAFCQTVPRCTAFCLTALGEKSPGTDRFMCPQERQLHKSDSSIKHGTFTALRSECFWSALLVLYSIM
ncbi:hypothetical protein GGP85_002673 [Salinibacter ruber]|nr:hypothetical protein [Salinibacter ruber]